MDRVAVEYPDRYLGIAAHLIPKEIEATITAAAGALLREDLALLRAARELIPEANSKSPQAVLEYCREALAAHSAKALIDLPADDKTAGINNINEACASRCTLFQTWEAQGKLGKPK
jgi:hypothetical protein